MITRRTTRRKLARTSRSLRSNARPIQVDKKIVDRLFKGIRADLASFKKSERIKTRPVWSQREVVAVSERPISEPRVFEIYDVAGNLRRIAVRLTFPTAGRPKKRGSALSRKNVLDAIARRDASKAPVDYLLGGIDYFLSLMDDLGVDQVVDIHAMPESYSLISDWTKAPYVSWSNVDSKENLASLRTVLEHELTHAIDVIPIPRKVKQLKGVDFPIRKPELLFPGSSREWEDKKSDWERRSKYFNLTHELRAYMFEILNEIRKPLKDELRRLSSARAITPGQTALALVEALGRSDTQATLEPYLGRKSRNILLKGIVTALEDEGIITIE